MNRAMNWLPGLAGGQPCRLPGVVAVIDGELDNRLARFIAVVPDPANPFAPAKSVGLLEGWGLAKAVTTRSTLTARGTSAQLSR